MEVSTAVSTEKAVLNPNLSEQNKKLIKLMASKLCDMISQHQNEDSVFKIKGFKKLRFIEEVVNETGINTSTVTRIYYSHVNKQSNAHLEMLAGADNKGEVKEENSKKEEKEEKVSDTKVFFSDNIVPYLQEGAKMYFVLEKLLEVLPISRKNKKLKSAFAVQGRKVLWVDGKKEHCIEVEKVKDFLQSYMKSLPEGKQKHEIRFFVDDIHRLILEKKMERIAAPAIVSETTYENKEVIKPSEKKEMTVVDSEVQNIEKVKAAKQENLKNKNLKQPNSNLSDFNQKQKQSAIQKGNNVVKKQTVPPMLSIDEEKEFRLLIRMLSNKIGFVSEETKKRMIDMAKREGLVKATVATMQTVGEIEDISLYFAKQIELKVSGCL